MKELATEVVVVLDKSGSMSTIADDTIGSFNQMLKDQKGKDDKAYITTVLFDHSIRYLHDHIDIDYVKSITNEEYYPSGSTALYDAIGCGIEKLENITNTTGNKKVVFFIITDGYENASRIYTNRDVRRKIEAKKEDGWEFVFLGADIEVDEIASEIGIEANRRAKFSRSKKGIRNTNRILNYMFSAARECEDSIEECEAMFDACVASIEED